MSRLVSSRQISETEINAISFDAYIGACGFEERCSHAAARIKFAPNARKIAVPFDRNRILGRPANERFFRENGFELSSEVDGSDGGTLAKIFHDLVASSQGVIRLAVDYSGMTRAWYGALIRSAFAVKETAKRIELTFIYSPSSFHPPPVNPPRNRIAEPLHGFCHLQANSSATALVIGLGYEPHRAAGIYSYLDPELTALFYTDPAIDPRFTSLVKQNNSHLFDEIPHQYIFPHPLEDLDYTASVLYDVVADLSEKYRVVIAPLGVKPFSLLSMLLVARYRFADLWRVSGAEFAPPVPRPARGPLLCYQIVLADP